VIVPDTAGLVLADHVSTVQLIDHHVHGYWTARGDRLRLANALNEADTGPASDLESAFDSQLGFALRAHCAPLLGLAPHVDPPTYWRRRSEFDEQELAGLFLPAAGVSDWLVDTGWSDGLADVDAIAKHSGARAHEIIRLEQIAELALNAPGPYEDAFRTIMEQRAATAVATKSILAYRGGFEGDLSEPTAVEVAAAAARWRDSGGSRLTDRVLLRFGLHEALRLGKPLQFHVGFGDLDADLRKADPLYLLAFLRVCGDTPIMLLHCYPYERQAGYLAQAFNNVYLDGGLAINHLGAGATAFIRRLLEMAPFRKILYSSDASGPAELHYLGARLWRNGIRDVVRGFVDAAEWSLADAIRVVDLIANRNAARVYGLQS
jgi:uncharacterized protein